MEEQEKNVAEPKRTTPGAKEIFAGDDEFLKRLEGDPEPNEVFAPGGEGGKAAEKLSQIGPVYISGRQALSPAKKIIIGCIGGVTVIMLLPVSIFCFKSVTGTHAPATVIVQAAPESASKPTPTPAGHETQEVQAEPKQTQAPASWKLAQTLYQKRDYSRAMYVYTKLAQKIADNDAAGMPVKDYLNLRIAICSQQLGDAGTAEGYFNKALRSSSPAVVALTNYHMAAALYQGKNYIGARSKAYQALGIIEALENGYNEPLTSNCYYLIAQALTADVAASLGQVCETPANWPSLSVEDPFETIDEAGLDALVKSGTPSPLKSVTLGPQISKAASKDQGTRWSIRCSSAPIEELLVTFASAGGPDVCWSCEYEPVHNRPVTVYLPNATAQKFAETAAGTAGLIASFDASKIYLSNPEAFSSVANRSSAIIVEAIAAWQRFALTYRTDKRAADAHFAMGLLQRAAGQAPTAIGEFRLISTRYGQSAWAPYALLNSGKIRLSIKDFTGARIDLKQLVVEFPECPVSDEANVLLADTSMATGDYENAAMIYRKVCNLDVSNALRLKATMGAAQCFYAMGSFTEASDWFDRYVQAAKQSNEASAEDVQTAYVMMAQSNARIGNLKEACSGYEAALAGQVPNKANFEITMELVNAFRDQDKFVESLEILERVDMTDLSNAQACRVWLTRAHVLRSMHLMDQAATLLEGKLHTTQDARLESMLELELAQCRIALGEWTEARENLCNALMNVEAGATMQTAQCQLAEVCVKLGENKEAQEICNKLLATKLADGMRQRVMTTLGKAYASEKMYDKAAAAFSGKRF